MTGRSPNRFIRQLIKWRHSAPLAPTNGKTEDNTADLVKEALKEGLQITKCPAGKGGGLGRRANYRNVHSGRLAGKT